MDLKLSEEQRILQEMVRDFAKNEVAPKAEQWILNSGRPSRAFTMSSSVMTMASSRGVPIASSVMALAQAIDAGQPLI